MPVEEEFAQASLSRDALITIGVFDGVHLGHKALLSKLKELASQRKLATVVVTFDQHPQEILSPRTKPLYLTDVDEKAALLKHEGVDAVVVLSFTGELAKLSALEFVNYLKKYLRMRGLVIGPDFRMGKLGEGSVDMLQTLGKDMGFTVDVIPPVRNNGDIVSSTTIRNAMAKGDMEKVRRMVGRPYNLHGQVVSGTGRGSGIGVPTANIELNPTHALPADGVYATRTYIDGKEYQSVTNIGKNPTFGGGKRTAEVHILTFSDNIYGRVISVDFVKRIRSEKKFSSAEELKKQIVEDIKQARAILNSEATAQHV